MLENRLKMFIIKTTTVKRGYFERRGNFERFAKSFCF